MAYSINKVTLVGNVGNDPEIRSFQNGNKVVNLSIATSERWKDKESGEPRTQTEWHRVVIFNQAFISVAEKYIKKGMKIYIEGQLQTRKWQDQNGIDKYTTEVVLGRFRGELAMIGSRNDSANIADTQDNILEDSVSNEITQKDSNPPIGGAGDLDDEIPF